MSLSRTISNRPSVGGKGAGVFCASAKQKHHFKIVKLLNEIHLIDRGMTTFCMLVIYQMLKTTKVLTRINHF